MFLWQWWKAGRTVPFLPQFLGTCFEMANVSLKFPKFGGSLHSSHLQLELWALRDSAVLQCDSGKCIYWISWTLFMIRLAAKMDGVNTCVGISTENQWLLLVQKKSALVICLFVCFLVFKNGEVRKLHCCVPAVRWVKPLLRACAYWGRHGNRLGRVSSSGRPAGEKLPLFWLLA